MEDYNTYTDEQFLQLIKGGDRKAFECIFKKYWPILFDTAYKRVKTKEAAEEIIQELFISLWCKRGKIQLTHTFSAYIQGALKYRIFNYIRNEGIKRRYTESVKVNQPHFNNEVEESLSYSELNTAIEKEISNLPQRCRQVFKLSRNENLTFKEIAGKLDISVNTVEKHVGKALKILRTNLKDHIASFLYLLLLIFGD